MKVFPGDHSLILCRDVTVTVQLRVPHFFVGTGDSRDRRRCHRADPGFRMSLLTRLVPFGVAGEETKRMTQDAPQRDSEEAAEASEAMLRKLGLT